MKKWNMIIDVARCTNCNSCFMADKDEHVDNDFPGYAAAQPKHGHRWINIFTRERGRGSLMDVAYLPTMCNQCDNAPCIKSSRNGAIYKRKDGIVIIDPEKSKGQRELVEACPYGHIWWNEEKQIPQKWIFNAHLLDEGWKEPRCVQVCAAGAMRSVFVTDDEMKKIADSEGLEILKPELSTKPRVYYKNLYRFTKSFIAGSVAYKHDGIEDCAADASVTLKKEDKIIEKTLTDYFGDFKFDGLEPGSGVYVLEISYKQYEIKKLNIELKDNIILEDLYI